MKKKMNNCLLMILAMLMFIGTAYALPASKSAHYPRTGSLSLSTDKQTSNTYAFKALGKTDNKVRLAITDAITDDCDVAVSVQMYVVNKWGNWIAFGNAQTIQLNCQESSHELTFTIREKKEFCIVVTTTGLDGTCTIPYTVSTFS